MGKSEKKEKKSKSKKRHHSSSDEEGAAYKEHRKTQKKAEKVAKAFGYSNDINPFGDSNLLKPFVWGKKQEKEKQAGKPRTDPEEERLKLMADIDRVRKRRHDRELEVEEMERLRTEEHRLREAAQYGDWMKKEEDYHIEQTKARSKIRLLEGREKPVDILAKNILLMEDFFLKNDLKSRADAVALARLESHVKDPVDMVEGEEMTVAELDQFIADADNYLQLETRKRTATAKGGSGMDTDYVSFWQSLKDIAVGERRRKRLREQPDESSSRGRHKLVEQDVKSIFGGKTADELKQLNKEILTGVQSGARADVEYWEAVAAEALLEAARIIVREQYAVILSRQLDVVNELRDEIAASEAVADNNATGPVTEGSDFKFLSSASSRPPAAVEIEERAGLGTGGEVDMSAEALALERSEAEKLPSGDAEEKMAQADEVALTDKNYQWKDMYAPRKPRYFNRVRTGFDWNKYNATHYDSDNPPPKFVLGYKFNIFYPDLIDKATTPKFFIEKCAEPGFAVLRFHAGPPYEDIAFKLVSKEWDSNRRSGFRCVFERGVLQLHFNFKRHWYRR